MKIDKFKKIPFNVSVVCDDQQLYVNEYSHVYERRAVHLENGLTFFGVSLKIDLPFSFLPSLHRIQMLLEVQKRFVIVDDITEHHYIFEAL